MNKFMKGTIVFFLLVIIIVTTILVIPSTWTGGGEKVPPTPTPAPLPPGPEPGPGPGPIPPIPPGPEPGPEPEPIKPYEGKFALLSSPEDEIRDNSQTPVSFAPNKKSGMKVLYGSSETTKKQLIPEGTTLNLKANKYVKNSDSDTSQKDFNYSQYYVLTGFIQYYWYAQESAEPTKVYLASKINISADDEELENKGTINATINHSYKITYPQDLKTENILLTQYIEPVYELHIFKDVPDFERQVVYTDVNGLFLAPALSKDTIDLDVDFQGLIQFVPSSTPENATLIDKLGFDLGTDGSKVVSFDFSYNPNDFLATNDWCKNVLFKAGNYNVLSLEGNEAEGTTIDTTAPNHFRVKLSLNTKVKIKLKVKKTR